MKRYEQFIFLLYTQRIEAMCAAHGIVSIVHHRVPWLASVLLRIFILGFIAFGFQGIVKVSPLFAAAEQL